MKCTKIWVNFVINIIVKALSRDVRANGPLVGSNTKVAVGRGRKYPRGTTTFRHLKGMIYLEIRDCTYYEKIKVCSENAWGPIVCSSEFWGPETWICPGPCNTIGGLLTCLNGNRLIFNISHFHLLIFFLSFFRGREAKRYFGPQFFIWGAIPPCPPPPCDLRLGPK